MRGARLSPLRLAACASVGLFVGAQPYYGAHFILVTLLCLPFRLNALVAYAFAWYSVPPLIPLLLYLSLEIGHFLLYGQGHPLSWASFHPDQVLNLSRDVALGSFVLGLGLALLGAPFVYLLARFFLPTFEQTAVLDTRRVYDVFECYRKFKNKHRFYVLGKLRFDPLTRELPSLLTSVKQGARLLDVGCGRGQYTLFVQSLIQAESIVGFDLDASKISLAQAACARGEELGVLPPAHFQFHVDSLRPDLDLSFEQSASESPSLVAPFTPSSPSAPATFDLILLFDVLHYLERAQQKVVLRQLLAHLAPGGKLLLRETSEGGGKKWARLFERLGKRLKVNQGSTLDFFSTSEIRTFLQAEGFVVQAEVERGVLSNQLLVVSQPIGAQESNAEPTTSEKQLPVPA